MVVTIPSVGLGIISDEQPQELPDGAWSTGLNVRFKDGYAQRISGHTSVLTAPSAAAYHVARYNIGGNWIHCTLAAAFADNGTTKTEITGSALTGGADDKFTSCILGGVFVLNNGKDLPQYWGGDTGANLAALTGWDANHKCKAMRAFKNYLIALNITKTATNYGSMVKWSDVAAAGTIPTVWTAAADNDAGEVDLAETPDSIVDALPLGDSLIVYKTSSMYGMQYIGGNDIWRFSRLPGTSGMLSQNCAVEIPSGHVVLTASDLIVHNGTGVQSIVDSKMRRWLFSSIDSTNYTRAFITANHAQHEVWVCFPSSLSTVCNRALIWNYKENNFTVRELPSVTAGDMGPVPPLASGDKWSEDTTGTWNTDTTTWDMIDISNVDKKLVMSSTASKVYVMDDSSTFDGTAYTATLERTGIAFGKPDRVKWIRSILPRIDAGTGTVVNFQLGATSDVEVGTTWGSTYTYTVGSTYKLDVGETGRFLGLRIINSTAPFRLKSLDIDYVELGAW
jgi:hypothetical protein